MLSRSALRLCARRKWKTDCRQSFLRENSISLQREMEHARDIYHNLRQINTMSGREGISELTPHIEKIVSLTERADRRFCENKSRGL